MLQFLKAQKKYYLLEINSKQTVAVAASGNRPATIGGAQ